MPAGCCHGPDAWLFEDATRVQRAGAPRAGEQLVTPGRIAAGAALAPAALTAPTVARIALFKYFQTVLSQSASMRTMMRPRPIVSRGLLDRRWDPNRAEISACHTRPFEHARNFDLGPAMAFAFVRSFHESKDFNRFLRRNGSDSGPEEFYHLGDKRVIAVVGANRAFAFLTLRSPPIAFRVFPINAHAPAFPNAFDLDQAVAVGDALDAFATGAHDCEERFDAVDAVPEKVGMRFIQ